MLMSFCHCDSNLLYSIGEVNEDSICKRVKNLLYRDDKSEQLMDRYLPFTMNFSERRSRKQINIS